jgi:predicted transcriptional regulator of viral defense system
MIGTQAQRLLGWAQLKDRTTLTAGEVARALALTSDQERKLLSRMTRAGLLSRVQRGRYLIPAKLPPGGSWNPGEYVLLTGLMQTLGARYQIGGPNAFQRYSLETQVPSMIYVYNDRLSGRRTIGGLPFVFIKVEAKRLGGTVANRLPDGTTVWMASLARTLMDAVYDWTRFNTLPRAFQWIRERARERGVGRDLVTMAARYGNISTKKRVGYLLESMGEGNLTQPLKRAASKSALLIPFDPSRPARGRVVREWGLIDNIPS